MSHMKAVGLVQIFKVQKDNKIIKINKITGMENEQTGRVATEESGRGL